MCQRTLVDLLYGKERKTAKHVSKSENIMRGQRHPLVVALDHPRTDEEDHRVLQEESSSDMELRVVVADSGGSKGAHAWA